MGDKKPCVPFPVCYYAHIQFDRVEGSLLATDNEEETGGEENNHGIKITASESIFIAVGILVAGIK